MGDPKKARKKYSRPKILWNSDIIAAEKEIVREFGLVNKKEIWKATAIVKGFTGDAKKLIPAVGEQSEIEKNRLLTKVKSYGLIAQDAQLAEILNVGLKDILERRIQTVVFKKGFSRSIKQARQFITHRHIKINGKIITSPSYLVRENEKESVLFIERSSLADEDHAERKLPEKVEEVTTQTKIEKKEEPKVEKKSTKNKKEESVEETSESEELKVEEKTEEVEKEKVEEKKDE